MLLTVADVFLRFFFNSPITGTTELTQFMMVCLLLGAAWCAVQGRHITVDLVMSRIPPRARAIINSINYLAVIGILVLLTWRGFLTSLYLIRLGYKPNVLLPVIEGPFHLVLALSFAIFCLTMVTLLIQKVAEAVKG